MWPFYSETLKTTIIWPCPPELAYYQWYDSPIKELKLDWFGNFACIINENNEIFHLYLENNKWEVINMSRIFVTG